MDEKSFYRAEIARMRAEDPSGNAETIRMMEQELLELELAEQGSEGELTRRWRENAEIIRRAEEKHAAEERAEPASEGRTSRLETIGGEEYDPFADWLNGGKEYGGSRAGRLGIDRHGEIYAREGESELDRKLLGLKWTYEQEPERREEIAAEAEALRREHPGEYAVTAERPLADYLLIDTPNEAYFEERPDPIGALAQALFPEGVEPRDSVHAPDYWGGEAALREAALLPEFAPKLEAPERPQYRAGERIETEAGTIELLPDNRVRLTRPGEEGLGQEQPPLAEGRAPEPGSFRIASGESFADWAQSGGLYLLLNNGGELLRLLAPRGEQADENYEWNQKAEKSIAEGEIEDSEGLIINQSGLNQLKYGDDTSNINDCGWIAAYNVRRMLGEDVTPSEVIYEMEDTVLVEGRLGTHPFRMARYLSEKGYDVTCTMLEEDMEKAAEDADAGIYFYLFQSKRDGLPRGHNVAFRRSKSGRKGWYTFYNWNGEKQKKSTTFSKFVKENQPFSQVLITVKKR